jgi:hypothetical protein
MLCYIIAIHSVWHQASINTFNQSYRTRTIYPMHFLSYGQSIVGMTQKVWQWPLFSSSSFFWWDKHKSYYRKPLRIATASKELPIWWELKNDNCDETSYFSILVFFQFLTITFMRISLLLRSMTWTEWRWDMHGRSMTWTEWRWGMHGLHLPRERIGIGGCVSLWHWNIRRLRDTIFNFVKNRRIYKECLELWTT